MKDAKTIFNEALDLLRDPKRWTQGLLARNDNGHFAAPDSENAVQWCSVGACLRAGDWDRSVSSVFQDASRRSDIAPRTSSLSEFNDNHTHSEVIALWEKVGREQGWMK